MKYYYFEIRSRQAPKKIINILNKTQKKLSNFFSIKIKHPNLFFVNSRKQFDQLIKMTSKPWMVGFANGNNIFILNPIIYTKESDHKNMKHFYTVLKHEYAHIALRKFCGHDRMPKWFNEGLACYLADQVKPQPSRAQALTVFKYFKKIDSDIYSIAYFWTNLLIRRFGRQKILRLVRLLGPNVTKRQFAKMFYKIYKIHYSKEGLSKIISKANLKDL